MILRLSGQTTGGALSIIEEEALSGTGAPTVHVFAPRGEPHAHRFLSAGKMLIILQPASLEGFFARLSEKPLMPQDELAALASEFGIRFP